MISIKIVLIVIYAHNKDSLTDYQKRKNARHIVKKVLKLLAHGLEDKIIHMKP